MSGFSNQTPAIPTILSVNTAINFAKGVPGTAGTANDTLLIGIKILKNAGPCTVTINSGFRLDTNAQDTTHYVFTGSTTLDTIYSMNWLNSAGPLQITASVANMAIIETQASAL